MYNGIALFVTSSALLLRPMISLVYSHGIRILSTFFIALLAKTAALMIQT